MDIPREALCVWCGGSGRAAPSAHPWYAGIRPVGRSDLGRKNGDVDWCFHWNLESSPGPTTKDSNPSSDFTRKLGVVEIADGGGTEGRFTGSMGKVKSQH